MRPIAALLLVTMASPASAAKNERPRRGAATSGTVAVGGRARMAYELSPSTNGRPIRLLLHGSGHDLQSWDLVVPGLSARGQGYLRPDLLGHGETHLASTRGGSAWYTSYSTVSQAEALKALILELDVKELEIAGISYGADVGYHLAADRDPALARRIRPVMTLANPYMARVDGYQKEVAVVRGREMFDQAYAAGGMSPFGMMLRMNPMFAMMEPLSYAMMRTTAEAYGRRKWDEAVPGALVEGRRQAIRQNRATTGRAPLRPEIEAALVQGATLSLMASLGDDLIGNPPPLAQPMRLRVLASTQDEYNPPHFIPAFAARMRSMGHQVEVTPIRGAPHLVNFTHPQTVAEAIASPAP